MMSGRSEELVTALQDIAQLMADPFTYTPNVRERLGNLVEKMQELNQAQFNIMEARIKELSDRMDSMEGLSE